MATDEYIIRGGPRVLGTGAGTNAGVSVTNSAVTGKSHRVCHISGSGDAAATVTIEMPAGTIKWRQKYAAAFTFGHNFAPALQAPGSTDVVLKISASTSSCEANLHTFPV